MSSHDINVDLPIESPTAEVKQVRKLPSAREF